LLHIQAAAAQGELALSGQESAQGSRQSSRQSSGNGSKQGNGDDGEFAIVKAGEFGRRR
jgi:hypothetical protein